MMDMDADDFEDLREVAKQLQQYDLAVAMRDLEGAVAEASEDEETDVGETVDDLTMPFHEEERELAFSFGLLFGALLQEEYPDDV